MFAWIVGVIHNSGLLGVFLLMTLENVFPPIPSELIMPLAGYEAAQGAIGPVGVVLAGTAGSVIGAVVWYWIGRQLGLARLRSWAGRHGRWLTLTPAEIDRADGWFRRWGPAAVFIGRTLPGVRGVICIPAGVAAMPFASFLIWSSLGSLVWCALLTWAGFVLKAHYAAVGHWLNPLADLFLAACLAIYLFRVIRFRPDRD